MLGGDTRCGFRETSLSYLNIVSAIWQRRQRTTGYPRPHRSSTSDDAWANKRTVCLQVSICVLYNAPRSYLAQPSSLNECIRMGRERFGGERDEQGTTKSAAPCAGCEVN
jgi:hypothetical protein